MRARLAGLLAVLMLLAGCAREIPSTYIPPEPTATPDSGIDVDLTALSSTMVFAEVYNMLDCPEDYLARPSGPPGSLPFTMTRTGGCTRWWCRTPWPAAPRGWNLCPPGSRRGRRNFRIRARRSRWRAPLQCTGRGI